MPSPHCVAVGIAEDFLGASTPRRGATILLDLLDGKREENGARKMCCVVLSTEAEQMDSPAYRVRVHEHVCKNALIEVDTIQEVTSKGQAERIVLRPAANGDDRIDALGAGDIFSDLERMELSPQTVAYRLLGVCLAPRTTVIVSALDRAQEFVVESVQIKSEDGQLVDVAGDFLGAVVHVKTCVSIVRDDPGKEAMAEIDAKTGVPSWLARQTPHVPGCSRVLRTLGRFARTGYRMKADDESAVPHSIVVAGAPGSGKSFAADQFASWMRKESEGRARVRRVSALDLLSFAYDQEAWEELFSGGDGKDASCIIVDDVYAICDALPASGISSKSGGNSSELAFNTPSVVVVRDKLKAWSEKMVSANAFTFFVVLCNADRVDLLPPALASHHTVYMGVPSQHERACLLERMICERLGREAADASEWSRQLSYLTSGFLPQDMRKMCDRALSLMDASWTGIRVFEELRKVALQTPPSELRDLDAKSSSMPASKEEEEEQEAWRGIGGYADVKKQLDQLVRWQWLHPESLKRIGVSQTSGVLLIGPSGCGKTMFAEAIARECRCNFVSVKASEILSKYLGESERIVRELFTRARFAAPCILFFDEIDGIAAKRSAGGSDLATEGTNVDERVLATLLNELDGVGVRKVDSSRRGDANEEESKVLVIAATSREDDLDAALLRPGRLGAIVRFHLPGASERVEIFKECTSAMPLHKDVDFERLASHPRMESATCADIKSACVEACMLAVRSHVGKMQSGVDVSVDSAHVTMEDFWSAIELQ